MDTVLTFDVTNATEMPYSEQSRLYLEFAIA